MVTVVDDEVASRIEPGPDPNSRARTPDVSRRATNSAQCLKWAAARAHVLTGHGSVLAPPRHSAGLMSPYLRGRSPEQAVLDGLLEDVRAGQGRVLILRGEAGVGKTALLGYAEERATTACRVVRTEGIESEMELAFAGLHQLCEPMLSCLERLPDPQREALSAAFGFSASQAPDRFMICLATLELLRAAAEEQPLVCLIDDAQWLDRSSEQALSFVARRLLSDSIAIVFSVRTPHDDPALTGLPELAIKGLKDSDAGALLDSVIPGPLDRSVRDRLVAETRGNPLALLELPRGLTAAELAGGFGRLDTRPLESRIEHSFLRQLETLPPDTQLFLLTAAAEPSGDSSLLWRAAVRLGITPDAAAPAEVAGLIELGPRTRFRHPLVRAAAYRAASLPDRRRAHCALAEATDPDADPDRRAWHLALAAVGPDESVADELERSAGRAQARGGVAAAAAFLEWATELTPDRAARSARALTAAHAKFVAAAPDSADELLTKAESGPMDDLQHAQAARLRAQLAFARRRGSDAPQLLLSAAERLKGLDPPLARETYLEAIGAAIFAGRLSDGLDIRQVAEAARTAPPAPGPPRPTDLLLDAMVTRFTEGYLASVLPLKRALCALRDDAGRHDAYTMGWLWTWCPVAPEPVARDLWDDQAWLDLAERAVALARRSGALAALPVALTYRAGVYILEGEFAAAGALIEEANAAAISAGNAALSYTPLLLAAWRGDEAKTLDLVDASVRTATASGEGRTLGFAWYATAILYNGLCSYDAALAGAQQACDHEDLGIFGWSLVELVEAAARSGANELAGVALERLDERTRSASSDLGMGLRARSRALLSQGVAAESLYREAIERLARSHIAVHLARAHLVYGEWLRREQRRVEAREHLRVASEMFHKFGASAFALRTHRELQATGEKARTRSDETRDSLTAQELQVARLAAAGHTNPEIGAQLFISPRTAEYHLHKVYSKLDIRSRRQLRGRIAQIQRQAG